MKRIGATGLAHHHSIYLPIILNLFTHSRKENIMNLTDIIQLAKQGYKPADIKELIALSTPVDEPASEPATEVQEVQATEDKKEAEPPTDNSDDYKKIIEEMTEKLKATEEKLNKLQHENVRRNIADTPEDKRSDVDVFNDAMRNFM